TGGMVGRHRRGLPEAVRVRGALRDRDPGRVGARRRHLFVPEGPRRQRGHGPRRGRLPLETARGPVLGGDWPSAPPGSGGLLCAGAVSATAPGFLPGRLLGLGTSDRSRGGLAVRRGDPGGSFLERDVATWRSRQGCKVPAGLSLRAAEGPLS